MYGTDNILFCFGEGDAEDIMDFSMNCKDDDFPDEEPQRAAAELSLDDVEYLAHRILDAVAFQRKMNENQ